VFGVADYWAFVVAVIVFLAIPGVGNLAIITCTGKGGSTSPGSASAWRSPNPATRRRSRCSRAAFSARRCSSR